MSIDFTPKASVYASEAGIEPAANTSRFVQADGLKLHYLDYGTEGLPPLLCVHGGAAHAHWFDFIAPGFTADYHVRSLDLRGHGDSDWSNPPAYSYRDYASDLNAAVEQLDLREFVLIGHSMGGIVSVLYAATYPGRVKSLIVIDSTMFLPAERVTALRAVGARPGGRYATQEELIKRYRLRPGSAVATTEVVRHVASHGSRQENDGCWMHKFDRNVYAMRETIDVTPCWNHIKIPALLVNGARSRRITPETYANVRKRCPQADLTEVPASDHHVTLDNPRGFVEVVQRFLMKE